MTYNESSQLQGWIKLHRKVKYSKAFANPEILKLWILCLCKANHSHTWVHLDGVSDPVEVQPGQFITGRFTLHREYYPSSTETNKTAITVWRWLEKLAKWGNLNIKTNNKYTVVDIVNWHLYQETSEDDQQNDQQVINRRSTDDQQVITDKNEKNVKNEKNHVQQAERIYNTYPRDVGKIKAIEKIKKALKKIEFDELLLRVELFAKSVEGQNSKYIPHPATWFNQERWEDDPDEWIAWKRSKDEDQQLTPQYLTKRLG